MCMLRASTLRGKREEEGWIGKGLDRSLSAKRRRKLARQAALREWDRNLLADPVVPVVPLCARTESEQRRVKRGRPPHPTVRWAVPLVADEVEPPRVVVTPEGRVVGTRERITPFRSLDSMGIHLSDYTKCFRKTKSAGDPEEAGRLLESFYSRPHDAAIFGLRGPTNVRAIAEINGAGGRLVLPVTIDTGATVNVAREEIFEKMVALGYQEDAHAPPQRVADANGRVVDLTRAVRVPLSIYPRKEEDSTLIYRMNLGCQADVLLGLAYADASRLSVDAGRHLLTWGKGEQKTVMGSIGGILRNMRRFRKAQSLGCLARNPRSARFETKGDERRPATHPSARGKKKAPRSVRAERKGESPKTKNLMFLQCLRERRSIEVGLWDEGIEDYDDQIVSCASLCDQDRDQVPVYTAGRAEWSHRQLRARESRAIALYPAKPLSEGHWIFVSSSRENYAGTLCWPDVHVRVKGKPVPVFHAQVLNVSDKPFLLGHTKMVGYMEKVRAEDEALLLPMGHDVDQSGGGSPPRRVPPPGPYRQQLVSRIAGEIQHKERLTGKVMPLETYDDFIRDRSIVDEDDPVQMAAHRERVWATIKSGIGQELNPQQEGQLRQLVGRYAPVFSAIKGQNPPVSEYGRLKPFEIQTGDSEPVAKKYYHRSPRQKREIERHVNKMLEDGIVRPSESDWACPVVLAMKKDGTSRFCVNYKPVNAVTQKDRYPLPRIDEILDKLGGRAWFSSLDMSAGYWVIPVAEKDRAKTAFVSHMGLHEFNVMPFGLTNAPAAYQRAMDCVLAGLNGLMCMAYIDDVIVFSSSFQDHCRDLEAVLERIRRAGMTVNARKCCLVRKELLYLGHVVTTDGVMPDPAKVSAVKDAHVQSPPP